MQHNSDITEIDRPKARAGRLMAARTVLDRWVPAKATFLIPVGLYLLASAVLLANLGGHPAFPYAWEPYTALRLFPFLDHPTSALLARNDAVMTDSGTSPLVVLPIWFGVALAGINLVAVRTPLALLTALAAPLLWAVGGLLRSRRVAATAAVLLLLMPPFILFGRTATNVGLSLVPALLTVYALVRVLLPPHSWGWILAVQVLLFLDQYAYSPIRFLWPISLVLLLIEALFQRSSRRTLLAAFAATALVLPALLIATNPVPGAQPWEVVKNYYAARGEQALAFAENPAGMRGYLRSGPADPAASPNEMLGRLVLQNTGDLTRVLLDQQTVPTILDYWKSDGRLYFGILVPFFLLGLVVAVVGIRCTELRILLGCFAGFTLPLLLTSRVDVGRLIFALPFLCLIVALGYWAAVDWLAGRIPLRWSAGGWGPRVLRYGGLAILLVVVAGATWNDYRIDPPPPFESRIAAAVREAERTGTDLTAPVALILGGASDRGVELIQVAGLRLLLGQDYEFVDLGEGQDRSADAAGRPRLYYGGLLDAVGKPGGIPNACSARYVVSQNLVAQFRTVTAPLASVCGYELSYMTPSP